MKCKSEPCRHTRNTQDLQLRLDRLHVNAAIEMNHCYTYIDTLHKKVQVLKYTNQRYRRQQDNLKSLLTAAMQKQNPEQRKSKQFLFLDIPACPSDELVSGCVLLNQMLKRPSTSIPTTWRDSGKECSSLQAESHMSARELLSSLADLTCKAHISWQEREAELLLEIEVLNRRLSIYEGPDAACETVQEEYNHESDADHTVISWTRVNRAPAYEERRPIPANTVAYE